MAASPSMPVVMPKILEMPVGIPNWRTIHKERLFFVDKTGLIADLVKTGRRLFLSRPRRMGKTTLCSILAELFAHGVGSFQGLDIEKTWPVDKCYPVIRLMFLGLNVTDAASFEADLCQRILDAYYDAGFTEALHPSNDAISSLSILRRRLRALSGEQPLVFLIDEWDYPISDNLDNPELVAALKEVLGRFYSWLREQDQARFVLVTGVMRYRDTSLFTGQDIQDVSMNPRFAALLGYTQEEIVECFDGYIHLAAQNLGMTYNEVLNQLKQYYDGFCFDEDVSVKVYCPFAVNKFFSVFFGDPNSVPVFDNYWMDSSGASASLVAYLRCHYLSPQEIIALSNQDLVMTSQSLREVSYTRDVTFNQLLVQSGYFSLKAITSDTKGNNARFRDYICGITNQDVKGEFARVLMRYLVSFQDEKVSGLASALKTVKNALKQGNIKLLSESFNQILCYVRYDAYKAMEARSAQDQGQSQAEAQADDLTKGQEQKPEPEVFYRTMLKLSLTSESIYTEDEVANNLGRSDLEATTKDHIYIFELKRLDKKSKSKAAIYKRLDDGESQILMRMYGNNRQRQGKPMTMVVLVICDLYRQICGWRTFKVQKQEDGLVAVDRHDDLVNVGLQSYDHHEGLIEPTESLS